MAAPSPTLRIGIYGPEEPASSDPRGCSLWAIGYAAALSAAGATPVPLGESTGGRPWSEVLHDLHGLVWTGKTRPTAVPSTEEERLCNWCRKQGFPLLAIDDGLLAMNAALGGTIFTNLPTERPEALQHRHPPEKGLRHAIEVIPGTLVADMYGEGEIVVNSEHRRGIDRVARGFRVSAKALDGVVEAIESESLKWFAVGVQWRPASASASGLDIQVFRGLLDAAQHRLEPATEEAACVSAA